MAAGVLLYVFANQDRWSTAGQTAGVIVASLFHSSGILGLVFVLIGWRVNPTIKYIAIFLSAAVAVYLVTNGSDSALQMYPGRYGYYTGENQISSTGSLFHISYIVVPALIGWRYRRWIYPRVAFPALLKAGIAAAAAVSVLNLISSTGASRLTIYLYFVPMMVYSAFLSLYPPGKASVYRTFIIGSCCAAGHMACFRQQFVCPHSLPELPLRN